MTRSRLALLLLLTACVAGCSQSSAVSSLGEQQLPAKSPERHTVAKVIAPKATSLKIPPVSLSTLHAKWCIANVGDVFPEVELPQLNGQPVKLSTLYGKQATVVLYWSADRWMSRMALEDLVSFVVGEHDPQQVAIVGIAIRQPAAAVRRRLNQAKATFPQLLDTNGAALAHVGSVALPRLYVLDPTGNIVWFDIEYSESTRRELAQTLRVLTGEVE
jgi:peroxiredoxin